jgi:glycosyltransferase involved in cell wall biosynthesis
MVVSAVFMGTGQQIKVVEALAHGVPVVALKSKTLSHLLEDGETGFIVSSAEEMASRIVQLFRDRSLCSRLGGEGRLRVAADSASHKGLPALFG